MSFKDFVAFVLRMVGFWMVINSILGVASASSLMTDALYLSSFGSQLPMLLMPTVVSVLIGLLLAFMPYKVTNFFIMSDVEVSAIPEFYFVLTRVGVALLGLYVMITGIQYFVENLVNFMRLAEDYSGFDDYLPKRNTALISQGVRVFLGFVLVVGSKVISAWLTKVWTKAKS